MEYPFVFHVRLARLLRRARPAAALALTLTAALALAGCKTETRVISSSWDNLPTDSSSSRGQGAEMFGQKIPHHYNIWAVQVATFYGNGRTDRAGRLIKSLTHRDGLDNVWLQDRSGRTVIVVGRFNNPRSGQARRSLQQVRAIQHRGERPYANARLVSLTITGKTYDDPYNLKAYHGEYTLQIGFYDGDGRKRNAVDAVKSLRRRGVSAYYYQGPNRSLITVGLFTEQEAFVTRKDPFSPEGSNTYVQAYAPAVLNLQKRFPYNLGNGKTIDEIIHGKNAGAQPSSLVQIP